MNPGSVLVGASNNLINEEGLFYVDERFLTVFDFNLIKGDVEKSLVEPRSLVLSESYVQKYFGQENPLGKELLIGAEEVAYKITGVIEDCPANSHIQFDMLGSISSKDEWNTNRWVGGKQYTYLSIHEQTDVPAFEQQLKALFYKYMAKEIEYFTGMSINQWEEAGNEVNYKLTSIKDIHLQSTFTSGELEPSGNIRYIYIYSLIGILILVVAIFNFVNLATAHSSTRAKEVGVRKVIGSSKRYLIYQFMLESVLVACIACLFAALIVTITSPTFRDLIGKDLAFHLTDHIAIPFILSGIALFVGLLSGFYPALVLSSFKPVEVLKGKLKSGMKSGWLRNFLVTLQFIVAIVITLGTVVIYDQINFMLTKSLGFDKEQILVIEKSNWLGDNVDVFQESLTSKSGVLAVTNSLTLPGKHFEIRSYRKKDEREVFLLLNNQVNDNYLEVMGMELVSGRFFSKEFKSDSNAVVINETAAKAFGFEDPIGKPLISAFKKGRPLKVIGVIKDYHVESLHKSVQPISLELDQQSAEYISLKIASGQDVRAVMASIEDSWNEMAGGKPFAYFFPG